MLRKMATIFPFPFFSVRGERDSLSPPLLSFEEEINPLPFSRVEDAEVTVPRRFEQIRPI